MTDQETPPPPSWSKSLSREIGQATGKDATLGRMIWWALAFANALNLFFHLLGLYQGWSLLPMRLLMIASFCYPLCLALGLWVSFARYEEALSRSYSLGQWIQALLPGFQRESLGLAEYDVPHLKARRLRLGFALLGILLLFGLSHWLSQLAMDEQHAQMDTNQSQIDRLQGDFCKKYPGATICSQK